MEHVARARQPGVARQRPDAARAARPASGPGGGLAAEVLALQRSVGNRAVAQLLGGADSGGDGGPPLSGLLRRASATRGVPDDGGQPSSGAGRPELVAARDPAAEADADRVADRAASRLGYTKAPAAGGATWPSRVPDAMAAALEPDLGDVGGVRLRSGGAEGRSADEIGALAYGEPGVVTIGSQAPSPAAVEGGRLMAHEVAHAVRHGSVHGPVGERVVHAKLAGTASALLAQGGPMSSGWLRNLVGKKKHWDRIVSGVQRVEAMEAQVVGVGRGAQRALARIGPTMVWELRRVEGACRAWQEANGGAAAAALSESRHSRYMTSKFKSETDLQPEDDRTKTERRQAVAMLVPRIGVEIADLMSGKWLQGITLSDATATGTGQAAKGAMNKVQEHHYSTEQGQLSGYFKEEKGFEAKPAGHDLDTGIRQTDPNYGARAVAMTRIDKLLGTSLLVRTEFATSGGKMGTVGATAQGTRAQETKFVLTDAEQATQPGTVSLEDPVLQKALNQMQVLDAICGQLDRHIGNWFVQADKAGRVTGISGIDLDMSFGKDLDDPDAKIASAQHYRGMPKMVDAELAQRILALSGDDVRAAVKGLLPDGEIAALIRRFDLVQANIAELARRGGLTGTWDSKSAAAAAPASAKKMGDSDKTSYQQNLHFDALDKLRVKVRSALQERDASSHFDALDKLRVKVGSALQERDASGALDAETIETFKKAASAIASSVFVQACTPVEQVLFDQLIAGKVEPAKAVGTAWAMIEALIAALVNDESRRDGLVAELKTLKPFQYSDKVIPALRGLAPAAFASSLAATTPSNPTSRSTGTSTSTPATPPAPAPQLAKV